MTDQDKNQIVEFNRGYNDGVKGRDTDDGHDSLIQIMTLGLCGGPREDSDKYHEGYEIGKSDRDNNRHK